MIVLGYKNKKEMVDHNPALSKEILEKAQIEGVLRVSNRSKKCTGSIDGETFIYSDGSRDTGELLTKRASVVSHTKYAWTEPYREALQE